MMVTRDEAGGKVKVFVVDDSLLMCKALRNIISQDPLLEYAGYALDGKEAIELLAKTPCDVCTFDVHMPVMNGITLLKHVMIRNPKPVLMLSAFTAEGARVTFDALRFGAVDFLQKPSGSSKEEIDAQSEIIREKIKKAARVRVAAAQYLRLKKNVQQAGQNESDNARQIGRITLMGANTGGYASLLKLLPSLPASFRESVLVALGASSMHIVAFVEYLKGYVNYPLFHGKDGDELLPGTVCLCSSQEGLSVTQKDNRIILHADSSVGEHKDGMDRIFMSVAEIFGDTCLGIMLSADGTDGLQGVISLKGKGSEVWVQASSTCLSAELPQKIIALGGIKIFTLPEMAVRLFR